MSPEEIEFLQSDIRRYEILLENACMRALAAVPLKEVETAQDSVDTIEDLEKAEPDVRVVIAFGSAIYLIQSAQSALDELRAG